ncbi:MAG: EF-P beta-lysylation protein EpmB [Gammaproteobacteria bacterium]
MSETIDKITHYPKKWQQQLAEAITSFEELCNYLNIAPEELPYSPAAASDFPLRIPHHFADCMEPGNPNDPLLRQVLPVPEEKRRYPGFSLDPVGDLPSVNEAGVLHKYFGRVLMINTGSCAIHCRYCFRRNFPYGEFQLGRQREDAAMRYVRSDASISEVILSGGDPLILGDARLERLIENLSAVEHVRRIRIHSRLPIVLPARVTEGLVKMLSRSSKQIVLVVHCNHAREISGHVADALRELTRQAIPLFNQSVLLKGVNDDADVLCDLSERLFSHGVIPYYLHLLDKAKGTGHFEVPKSKGLALIAEVQNRLPGYLVPRLVHEVAGAQAKQYVLPP